MTAFEKYLLCIPKSEAVEHVICCLKYGEQNNAAWELMAKYNGENWSCEPSKLYSLIIKTVEAISVGEAS